MKMASRDERIANLAASLRASGVAKSDGQARMMAEEMIGVEEHVQRRFDEEHGKAQEFLKTAKNLGQPRPRIQPEELRTPLKPIERKEEPLKPIPTPNPMPEKHEAKPVITRGFEDEVHERQVKLEPVHTDSHYGNKSLKDLMFEQIEKDGHEIQNIEELKPNDIPIETVVDHVKHTPRVEQPAFHEEIKAEEVRPEEPILEEHLLEEPLSGESLTVEAPSEELVEAVPQKLDSEKLVEMMEEDGKMEEHTREIKEKPVNVKPKEEYEENKVDLGSIFGVHK
jgi:hypothetical protein